MVISLTIKLASSYIYVYGFFNPALHLANLYTLPECGLVCRKSCEQLTQNATLEVDLVHSCILRAVLVSRIKVAG
jgi:hypothetical protein